jgi:hypothetical protein
MGELVQHLVAEAGLKTVASVHVVAKVDRAYDLFARLHVFAAGSIQHTSPFTKWRDAYHHQGDH